MSSCVGYDSIINRMSQLETGYIPDVLAGGGWASTAVQASFSWVGSARGMVEGGWAGRDGVKITRSCQARPASS